jgi:hypothetical protein
VHVNVQPSRRQQRSKRPAAPPPPQPPGTSSFCEFVGQAVQRMPPWGVVIVFVVLIAAYAYLAVHGKAPVVPVRHASAIERGKDDESEIAIGDVRRQCSKNPEGGYFAPRRGRADASRRATRCVLGTLQITTTPQTLGTALDGGDVLVETLTRAACKSELSREPVGGRSERQHHHFCRGRVVHRHERSTADVGRAGQ